MELNDCMDTLCRTIQTAYEQCLNDVSGLFEHSALESIKLPSKLKILGTNTFRYCEHLKAVELPASLEGIGSEVFEGCT